MRSQKNFNFFDLKDKASQANSLSSVVKVAYAQLSQNDDQSYWRYGIGRFAIFKSGSTQFASRISPRVVSFRQPTDFYDPRQYPDFTMAFSGHSPGNILEIIDFDYNNSAFCFRKVEVVKNRIEFDDAPTECADCHGADPRPIWEPYPLWPGVYGGVPTSKQELAHFRLFSNNIKKGDLYSLLWQKKKSPELADISPNTVGYSTGITHLNLLRIARLIEQTPLFKEYRFAILAATIGCSDIASFVPHKYKYLHVKSEKEVLDRVQSAINISYKKRVKSVLEAHGNVDFSKELQNQDVTLGEVIFTAKIAYLLENRSDSKYRVSMHNWSMSELDPFYSFNGNISKIRNLAYHFFKKQFQNDRDLKEKANQHDVKLLNRYQESAFHHNTDKGFEYIPENKRVFIINTDKNHYAKANSQFCQYLKTKSI
jgi:hypothetical protein